MKSTYDHGTVGDIRSAMGKPEKPDSGTELQAEGVEVRGREGGAGPASYCVASRMVMTMCFMFPIMPEIRRRRSTSTTKPMVRLTFSQYRSSSRIMQLT